MIQYIKFGQNLPFGSRYMVQTSFFFSFFFFFLTKFDIQNTCVTLKMKSRSSKSNHFFPMFHRCFCASLVKIHQFVQEIEYRQGSFLQSLHSIVWWPWKLGQCHQNLIKSLNHPNITTYEVWLESVVWFASGDRVQTSFFRSKFDFFTVFIVWWPSKLGQGRQNITKSLNHSNVTIHEVWSEPVIWFKR